MSELDESTVKRLDSSYTLEVLSSLEESGDIRSDEIVKRLEVNDMAEKKFNQTARALERIGIIDSQIENGSVQWNVPDNFSYGKAVEQIEDQLPYFSTISAREQVRAHLSLNEGIPDVASEILMHVEQYDSLEEETEIRDYLTDKTGIDRLVIDSWLHVYDAAGVINYKVSTDESEIDLNEDFF